MCFICEHTLLFQPYVSAIYNVAIYAFVRSGLFAGNGLLPPFRQQLAYFS